MVALTINGIQVDFPYPPYPPQVRYMSSVIDSLRHGSNALLESPTGTGKTLCLLCAALAWRSVYLAALQALARATPSHPADPHLLSKAGLRPPQQPISALTNLVRPGGLPQLSAPRIIFSSRTHSQLAQAVAELKKTIYQPAMAILASRDQLCLHDMAGNLSGSRLNAMCRRITAPTRRQCRYHLPVASSRSHENRAEELVNKAHAKPPMDIEDLRAFGASEGACPWFLARAAAKAEACEILFLPYNYLLDRTARSSLGIDWTNDVIIIDEAHNMESLCADSMSFDLSENVRKACDAELGKLIEHAVRPGGIVIPALEELTKTEAGVDKVIGSEQCELMEIRLMRSMLMSLEDFINKVQMDRGKGGDITFKVFKGGQLRKILEAAGGPTVETYELFLELLDRAMGVQADKEKPSGAVGNTGQLSVTPSHSTAGNTIRILQTAIRILFENCDEGSEHCFRTVVQQSATKPAAGRTISFWCFKPAIAMNNMRKLNMRCMLLTSGTLSPMDSFAAELGLDFPVRLENPHVVSQPQIWAGVVRSGPDHEGTRGSRLTSAYHARGDAAHLELGRAVIKIASLVPDGLLVFFPSYGSMYSCTDVWKRCGPGSNGVRPSVWEHLLRHKRIVTEERESAKFSAAILAHRTNVDARAGSILLAVCRGKVSEGIDFSDEYGRAVVITGLPYPSAMDPKVVLKREYADEELKESRQGSVNQNGASRKSTVIGGSEWYTIQALRAVNQAIGRAIRHKYDYGAIVLCDERFQAVHLQSQVSKWIRPSLTVHPTFQTAETALRSFFVDAVQSSFAKEGEQKRLAVRNGRALNVLPRKPEEDTNAVVVAQQAIASILPRPKTEKQFLEQVLSMSEELKAQDRRERANMKRKALVVQERPNFKVLDFSEDTALNVRQDSGCLRAKQSYKVNSDAQEYTQSAAFLTARAERIEQDKLALHSKPSPRVGKRIRLSENLISNSSGSANTEEKKRPLSEQIKTIFPDKKDVREFLRLFREVLTAHAMTKEEAGPLQTLHRPSPSQEESKQRIHAVVQFTKHRSDPTCQQSFFRDLRSKIPLPFRSYYDQAMHPQRPL